MTDRPKGGGEGKGKDQGQGKSSGEKSGGGDPSKQPEDRYQKNSATNSPATGGNRQGGLGKSGKEAPPVADNSPAGATPGTNWNGQGSAPPQSPISPDDPNLNYAKKATELALDHLRDAMKNGKEGDQLLKELGWTREEAQQFVNRQEARLRAAAKANPQDDERRQAEDALRGLGLRPENTVQSAGGLTSDEQRGMSTGRRTAPPPEYQEQFKAFSQGVNQGSGR